MTSICGISCGPTYRPFHFVSTLYIIKQHTRTTDPSRTTSEPSFKDPLDHTSHKSSSPTTPRTFARICRSMAFEVIPHKCRIGQVVKPQPSGVVRLKSWGNAARFHPPGFATHTFPHSSNPICDAFFSFYDSPSPHQQCSSTITSLFQQLALNFIQHFNSQHSPSAAPNHNAQHRSLACQRHS